MQLLNDNTNIIRELINNSTIISYAKMESSIKINYSRTAMIYGWEKIIRDGKFVYYNVRLNKTSNDVPRYQAEEQVLS